MHKHSEPEKRRIKVQVNSSRPFEQKNSEAVFFASDSFNIPYQVCLTGTVDQANFASSIHSAKNVSNSANFAARIRQILPVHFTFFADSLYYKFYIHNIINWL